MKLRTFFFRLTVLATIALFGWGCTAQARKARAQRRADEFYQAGDYESAKLEYINLLRADPHDAKGFEKLGSIWLDEGAPLRAGPFLAQAKVLDGNSVSIRKTLAAACIEVGQLEQARKEVLEALKLSPGNEELIFLLADAARTPEEIAEAEEALKSAAKKDSVSYYVASATIFLRKGNIAGMEPDLVKAVAADPKSSIAHLTLGRLRAFQGNREGALSEFKMAADLSPVRSPAQSLYAEFLVQSGAPDEAIKHLNGVVKKAPDFLPAWVLLAKLTAPKNYDEALALLENVFRRDAQNFDARVLQGEFTAAKGDAKGAIEVMKQLEKAYPTAPLVKLFLGRMYLANNDSIQAASSLSQAISLQPNYEDAIMLLADINLRAGNPSAVVSAMDDVLKANPTSERAQTLLADAYRRIGRPAEAEAILRKKVADAPEKSDVYLLLGVFLRESGKLDGAHQALVKALELAPDNFSTLSQLIEVELATKDYQSAQRRADALIAKSPESAAGYMVSGRIYSAQRDWENAERALRKAIELNPNIPSTYELLVSTYVAGNKLPQAAAEMEAFLAKDPTSASGLITLGLIYTEMKDFPKARDAYEKLLAFRPDQTMAMNNLAYLYNEHLNQPDKAFEWVSKARTAEPGNPAIADTFGWVLYKKGDYKQAANVLKESASKLPSEPEAQYHLGMANYMMGDSQGAKTALEMAANSPKDFPGKEEAGKRLALLGKGAVSGDEKGAQIENAPADDPLALSKAGDAFEAKGDHEKAGSSYEQAIKINPTLADPTIRLAQLYAGPLGKQERAAELAKKGRSLAPADARPARILGRLAMEAGNFSGAYSLLRESVRQAANDSAALKDLAWAAYSLGKVPEARETMEQILKGSASSAEATDAKTFLSLTSPDIGENREAQQTEAARVLKSDPVYTPALMVEASARIARNEKDAAADIYQKILARLPDFALAQNELAALYLDDSATQQKAYELATSARKALPEDAGVAAVLGKASYVKKEYPRAAQLLQESRRKKPLDAQGLFSLGMALREIKNSPAAVEALQAAVTKGLSAPLESEAKSAIEALKSE